MMTKYTFDKETQILSCQFSDKLDTEASVLLEREIETYIYNCTDKETGNKPTLVFDFAQVDFVTSAFIRICVKNAKFVGKQNFSIINSNPLIKKIFKIAGLDGELNLT